jgi:hypothetical protein
MTEGAGKYNQACNTARLSTGARCIVLIIFDGNRGDGFEVQTTDVDSAYQLPETLRLIADQIDRDNKAQAH